MSAVQPRTAQPRIARLFECAVASRAIAGMWGEPRNRATAQWFRLRGFDEPVDKCLLACNSREVAQPRNRAMTPPKGEVATARWPHHLPVGKP